MGGNRASRVLFGVFSTFVLLREWKSDLHIHRNGCGFGGMVASKIYRTL